MYLLSSFQICIVPSIVIILFPNTIFFLKDISEHLLNTISVYISFLPHSPLFPLYPNHFFTEKKKNLIIIVPV